jgi:hypothetical protein
LLVELETLTRPITVAFREYCQGQVKFLRSLHKAEAVERFEKSQKIKSLLSNEESIFEAIHLVGEAVREVRTMEWKSIPTIKKRIEELKKSFTDFDLSRMAPVNIGMRDERDLMSLPNADKFAEAYNFTEKTVAPASAVDQTLQRAKKTLQERVIPLDQ